MLSGAQVRTFRLTSRESRDGGFSATIRRTRPFRLRGDGLASRRHGHIEPEETRASRRTDPLTPATSVSNPPIPRRIRWGMVSAARPSMLAEECVTLRPKPDLRERALCLGPEQLADVDLLALVVGTGSEGESARSVAVRLLDSAGSVLGIARLGGHGLAERRGIGPAKAARILAALELGRRAGERGLSERRPVIDSFEAVAAWARPRLALLEHEEVWVLSLDGRNGLRGAHRVAQGGLHGCALLPRDVLRPAIRDGASAIVLLHNHPSGDPAPSAEDIHMTRGLAAAAHVVGLTLLDHVVVARGGAASLRDSGAFGE
jgi:DNA repair protein RadC